MKDPAFLFYSNDFSIGTQFLSDEQVGKYVRLLLAQHQHGHLTEKQMLFICKSYDFDIVSKFKKDDNECYYNERLEVEINRRKAYSESRGKNKKGKNKAIEPIILKEKKKKSYDNHMETENEIENKDIINKKGVKILKKIDPPSLLEVEIFFKEKGFGIDIAKKAFEYYATGDWKDSRGNKVINWKQKMISVWLKDENKPKIDGKQHNYNKTGVWSAEGTAIDAIAQLRNRREAAY